MKVEFFAFTASLTKTATSIAPIERYEYEGANEMSIKAMTWVWDNAEYNGSKLLLLLAIADHCNDDGECFPGVSRLAKKCRLSHTHTQTLIRELKEAKDITVLLQQGIETGTGQTNIYHLNGYRISIGRGIVDSTPVGDRGIAGNMGGVLPTVPKPSVELSVESSVKKIATDVALASTDNDNSPIAEKVKQRSPKQLANDALVETIGLAFGIEAKGKDYGLYLKTAQTLNEAGISSDSFGDYVSFVRKLAGDDWKVSIPSLVAKGRPSEYVASRNKKPMPAPKLQPVTDVTPIADEYRESYGLAAIGDSDMPDWIRGEKESAT